MTYPHFVIKSLKIIIFICITIYGVRLENCLRTLRRFHCLVRKKKKSSIGHHLLSLSLYNISVLRIHTVLYIQLQFKSYMQNIIKKV